MKQGKLTKGIGSEVEVNFLYQRLEQPTPRVGVGQMLVGLASAAIDISDGLVADLGHILHKSRVGAQLDIEDLPISTALSTLSTEAEHLALYAGDNYELCFTVPPKHNDQVQKKLKGQCTRIGTITGDDGIVFFKNKKLIKLSGLGYEHFSTGR
jgi:thiamine-monophosphate kinase